MNGSKDFKFFTAIWLSILITPKGTNIHKISFLDNYYQRNYNGIMKKTNILETHVGYWLRFVSNHVSASFAKKLALHEVGVGDWVVLNMLNDQKVLSPAQIASSTKMTRGAVSKLLDRLYLKQLVSRVESHKDRRYQEITLSESGKKLLPKLKKLAEANEHEFFGHLEKEQKIEIIKHLQEIVCTHKWDEIPIK